MLYSGQVQLHGLSDVELLIRDERIFQSFLDVEHIATAGADAWFYSDSSGGVRWNN